MADSAGSPQHHPSLLSLMVRWAPRIKAHSQTLLHLEVVMQLSSRQCDVRNSVKHQLLEAFLKRQMIPPPFFSSLLPLCLCLALRCDGWNSGSHFGSQRQDLFFGLVKPGVRRKLVRTSALSHLPLGLGMKEIKMSF